MRWLDICEQDKDRLNSYERFLKHYEFECHLLPPELAAPFQQPVHICGVGDIAQSAPLTSPWAVAERMVEHAWQAASNPDPEQTINLHGNLTLLYTVPVTETKWAVCALQSYWNEWDDEPAHAIHGQTWGLQTTPRVAPRDPGELWAARPADPRQIKADQEGRN